LSRAKYFYKGYCEILPLLSYKTSYPLFFFQIILGFLGQGLRNKSGLWWIE